MSISGKKTMIAAAGNAGLAQYLITYTSTGQGITTRLLSDGTTIASASSTQNPYVFVTGHELEDGSEIFTTQATSYTMYHGSIAESADYIVVGGTSSGGVNIYTVVTDKSGNLVKQQIYTFSLTYNSYGGMYAIEDDTSSNTLVYAAYNDSVCTGYAAYNITGNSISNIANYQYSAYGAGPQQYRGRNTRLSSGRFIKVQIAGYSASVGEINGTSLSGSTGIGQGTGSGAYPYYYGVSVDDGDSDNIYLSGFLQTSPVRGRVVKMNSGRGIQWQREIYDTTSGKNIRIAVADVTSTHVVGFGSYDNEGRVFFWDKNGTFDNSKTIRITHASHSVSFTSAQVLPDGKRALVGLRLYTSATVQDAVIAVFSLDNPPNGTYAGLTFGPENQSLTEAAGGSYSTAPGTVGKAYSYSSQGTSSTTGPSGTKTSI